MRSSVRRESGMPSRWRRIVLVLPPRLCRFVHARGQLMTERLVRLLGRERCFWRLLAMALRWWVVCSVPYRCHEQTGRYRPCNCSNAPRKKRIFLIGAGRAVMGPGTSQITVHSRAHLLRYHTSTYYRTMVTHMGHWGAGTVSTHGPVITTHARRPAGGADTHAQPRHARPPGLSRSTPRSSNTAAMSSLPWPVAMR